MPRLRSAVAGIAPQGIAQQIVTEGGRVTFARFMDLALTHPTEGYYANVETLLGPRGHFSTAPVLSPEFNATVAMLVEELVVATVAPPADWGGEPVESLSGCLRVVELGGGEGHSALAVLTRLGQERTALKEHVTYTIVEVGEGLRARQRRALARPIEEGWRVGWASTITEALAGGKSTPAVVIGNEFVDALPVHLLDVRGDTTREAWVEVDGYAVAEGGARGVFGVYEVWDAVGPEAREELYALFGTQDAATLRRFTGDGFIELRPAAGQLMRQLPAGGFGGCLLTVDYGEWFGIQGDLAAANAPGPVSAVTGVSPYRRTLRGYCRHQPVSDMYARIGAQDLTADVDFRALDLHGRSAGFETVLYTTVGAMLRGDSGAERLAKLEASAAASLETDRRATVLRALLDDQEVGGAFKVMLQVRGQ